MKNQSLDHFGPPPLSCSLEKHQERQRILQAHLLWAEQAASLTFVCPGPELPSTSKSQTFLDADLGKRERQNQLIVLPPDLRLKPAYPESKTSTLPSPSTEWFT